MVPVVLSLRRISQGFILSNHISLAKQYMSWHSVIDKITDGANMHNPLMPVLGCLKRLIHSNFPTTEQQQDLLLLLHDEIFLVTRVIEQTPLILPKYNYRRTTELLEIIVDLESFFYDLPKNQSTYKIIQLIKRLKTSHYERII